jgi:hypothetical protein
MFFESETEGTPIVERICGGVQRVARLDFLSNIGVLRLRSAAARPHSAQDDSSGSTKLRADG